MGIEFAVFPDYSENFLAKLVNEIGLPALYSLMREQSSPPLSEARGTAMILPGNLLPRT